MRLLKASSKATILTSQHQIMDRNLPVYFSPLEFPEVVLEDGCDIGPGAIILPGVRVGEGAILEGGAVLIGDIPLFEIWAGVPARRIKVR